jgi:hypothetical protein
MQGQYWKPNKTVLRQVSIDSIPVVLFWQLLPKKKQINPPSLVPPPLPGGRRGTAMGARVPPAAA